jgi:hypothetical protein
MTSKEAVMAGNHENQDEKAAITRQGKATKGQALAPTYPDGEPNLQT